MTSGGDHDAEVVVTVVEDPVSGVDVVIALVASAVDGPVIGTITITRGVVGRVTRWTQPLVRTLVLRPPLVPARLQPGTVLARLSRRGRRERTALLLQLDSSLDTLVPRLTDELVRRLDLDALVTSLDVAQLVQRVIAEVDLPEIIRESTGAVSSEAVREVRMRGIAGDDTVGRAVDRLLLRHRGRGRGPATSPLVPSDPTVPGAGVPSSRRHPAVTSGLPVSPVPHEARSHQGRRAGLVSRIVAGVLDLLVLLVLLALGYLAANATSFIVRPRTFEPLTAAQPVLLAVAGGSAVVYLAGTWWIGGRTYGCHVMGLRVVDRRGRSPRLLVAVLRAATYVVFPIGVLWCAVTGSRRSLQDLLLGTYVLYDWMPS